MQAQSSPAAPPAFSILDSDCMRARICVNVPSIAVTSSSRWPDPRAMRRRRDAVCAQKIDLPPALDCNYWKKAQGPSRMRCAAAMATCACNRTRVMTRMVMTEQLKSQYPRGTQGRTATETLPQLAVRVNKLLHST